MDADARAREVVDRWAREPPGDFVLQHLIAADLRAVEREARQEERERCAKVADDEATKQPGGYGALAMGIAAAIRALVDEPRAAKEDGHG